MTGGSHLTLRMALFVCLFIYFETASCSPGWPGTHEPPASAPKHQDYSVFHHALYKDPFLSQGLGWRRCSPVGRAFEPAYTSILVQSST